MTDKGSPFWQTGNDILVLHEIRHALRKLLDSSESTVIDLRALPMSEVEQSRIEDTLGVGEVQASVNALGVSEVVETRISGVWRITHYNTEREVLGKFIEITTIPSLLTSQTEDMAAGLERLTAKLTE